MRDIGKATFRVLSVDFGITHFFYAYFVLFEASGKAFLFEK